MLGRILGPLALHGWVKIKSYTERAQDILAYDRWILIKDGEQRVATVAEGRVHGQGVIARLDDCADRERASEYSGATIAVPLDQLRKLDQGEYYWVQLVGLNVRTTQGVWLGTVDRLFETGANDVMVVHGDRERLLPYLPEVVREVNIPEKLVTVDWDPEF